MVNACNDDMTADLAVPNLLVLSHANLHNVKECSYDVTQFAQYVLQHYHLSQDDDLCLGLEFFSPDFHYNKGRRDSSVTKRSRLKAKNKKKVKKRRAKQRILDEESAYTSSDNTIPDANDISQASSTSDSSDQLSNTNSSRPNRSPPFTSPGLNKPKGTSPILLQTTPSFNSSSTSAPDVINFGTNDTPSFDTIRH